MRMSLLASRSSFAPTALPLLAVTALSGLLSCGGPRGTTTPAPLAPSPAGDPAPPAGANANASAAKPGALRPTFENPGGMWMPHQIVDHAATLKELGLQIDPASLADPTSGTLSAVVSLGGCSASFISPDGLVATNHHCATGALQHNSTPAQNLIKDGWLAKTRADEKNNGPQARIFVTRAVTDVTAKVLEGAAKITDDRARFKAIEGREKEIVAACEKGKKGTRCNVASFYEGAAYYLVEQLEIRDVRLVWAPPAGVGNYGGEIDNWRWPRHTGDVSMFRAYVGKDGQPADYSPDNVPYHPPHWLKVAKEPLREGDLVFVAGYPGRTSSLKTGAEVAEAVSWTYPRKQRLFEEYIARVEEVTKDDKEAQIRATSYLRRWNNALTNTKGQLEGLVKGGLAAEKERGEGELRAFIAADPARKAAYGTVLDDIAKEVEKNAKHREVDTSVKDEIHLPKLVGAASAIVRMAEERAKPDAERDPEYQERNWPRHVQGLEALAKAYHRKVDEGILRLALERAAATKTETPNPALVALFGKGATPTNAQIAEKVKALYDGTKLADDKARVALFKTATSRELAASKDPLVQLAVALRPALKEAEERQERMAGRLAALKPKYIEALKAFKKAPIAPDANSTLRITYGTVRGYRPSPEAAPHKPFTVLSEVVAKNKGKEPFDVPERLLAAQRAKKLGPYVDDRLGEIPVDFLADLHITGGNSGSATLNAKGELVGLVFDGNYEAMASDWQFVPSVTRSIHVDVRYILWLLDAAFGGDHLVKEMGLEPKVE